MKLPKRTVTKKIRKRIEDFRDSLTLQYYQLDRLQQEVFNEHDRDLHETLIISKQRIIEETKVELIAFVYSMFEASGNGNESRVITNTSLFIDNFEIHRMDHPNHCCKLP